MTHCTDKGYAWSPVHGGDQRRHGAQQLGAGDVTAARSAAAQL
jgi:hypothetical protein